MDGVFPLRLRFAAFTPSPGSTTGNFNLALRFVSGRYTDGGGFSTEQRRKTLFPRRDVKVIGDDGYMSEQWYRILQFMYEVKQGGDLAPSVPDIQTNFSTVQTATIAVSGLLQNTIQTVQTNAASQAASTEVAVNAGIPGAAQIPVPVQTVPDFDPPEPYDPLAYKRNRE